ncbi:MAG: hypothetical protein KatS3mg102_2929 [Planctomycetota bacterium]|nr:MAG: hypothetical protein KatS3mg102_2929 [Planctomycetota bacterium]
MSRQDRRTQGRRRAVRARQKAAAREREALERRFVGRLAWRRELEQLVSARGAAPEPRHRWFPYRQGFAPALVRRFLEQAERPPGPVLDPFAGSGTTAIECARQGVAAIGVEAIPELAAIGAAALLPPAAARLPPPPAGPEQQLGALAARLHEPAHRAALLIALARSVRGDGTPRRHLPPLGERLRRCWEVIAEDLAAESLRARAWMLAGDARRLPLRAASCGALLTSPPYLGRFEYARLAAPFAALAGARASPGSGPQLPAARHADAPAAGPPPHPAAAEACARLWEGGRRRAARVVAGYVRGLAQALAEAARVLVPAAPAWIVLGGAFVHEVYVPADLIAAELAERAGFRLEGIEVARALSASGGRRLGGLARVRPRESVLRLVRLNGR